MNEILQRKFASVFEQDYPGIDSFITEVINNIFTGQDCFVPLPVAEDYLNDQNSARANDSGILRVMKVGTINALDDIDVFDITLSNEKRLEYNRVGIQQFVISPLFPYTNALMLFHNEDVVGKDWRFSFAYKQMTVSSATSAKRFTYLFGRNHRARTASERFANLADEPTKDTAHMLDAFSVQKVSDEFFDEYREQYGYFCDFLFEHRNDHDYFGPEFAIWEDKYLRDYVKKMLGRITFIYFLQRKGWMNGDMNYMQNAFLRSDCQDDYLDVFLEPLFFGVLNTKPEQREQLFREQGWDLSLLDEWANVPYLNGGLFERDEQDSPKSRFPADKFKGLFEFYARYNFTIDENDPDDAEVGVDPEMLGKIFESLLEDNKDKGAFYTPKEIVDYMCQESLIAYLQTNVTDEAIRDSIRKFVETREADFVNGIDSTLAQKINKQLIQVKICDPAIGSGAFPMGLLNLLVKCREALGNGTSRVDLKREIIQNNIYGVDIEKGAIDIARLRFWLSLIVDEEMPQALPNLDYKIVEGNSLLTTFDGQYVNLDTKMQRHYKVAEMKEEKRKLYQLKKDFYNANGEHKMDITIGIKDAILRLIAMQLGYESRSWLSRNAEQLRLFEEVRQLSFDDVLPKLPEEIQQIIDHCKQLHQRLNDKSLSPQERAQTDIRFFDWRIIFTEIFDNDNPGFDIVIGNPPYVEAKKLKYIASTLKKIYNVYSGTADLSIYFAEHGLNILSQNGILSFITTNKFFNTGYGKKLRELITSNTIKKIINFEQVEVFEDILVSSAIIEIVKNSARMGNTFSYEKFYKLRKEQFIPEFVSKQNSLGSYSQDYLDEREWSFSNMTELELKSKIERDSKPLSEIEGISINRGVTTGYNPAFIISDEKKDILIKEDASNRAIIKNMLQGRNIRKWYYNESDENLLFIPWHFPLVDENISGASADAEQALIDKYPSIYKWLETHKDALSERNQDETGIRYEWYALQRCAASYYKEFEYNEKIIWGLTADKWAFTIDKEQHYLPSNGYILTSTITPIRYVLGLLNSKLMHYYFHFTGIMTAGGAYTLKAATISALPFKIANDTIQISSIVDKILSIKEKNHDADVSKEESQIDILVYHLYGLTYDEVKIVDPETSITPEEYESKL